MAHISGNNEWIDNKSPITAKAMNNIENAINSLYVSSKSAKSSVDTVEELSTISYAFVGLTMYVKDEEQIYVCKNVYQDKTSVWEPASISQKYLEDSLEGYVTSDNFSESLDELNHTDEELRDLVSATNKNISSLVKDKADKATTLAGYGITDAFTKDEIHDLIDGIESSGGIEDFIIEATGVYDDSNAALLTGIKNCSASYGEIYEAYEAGKNIKLTIKGGINGETIYVPLIGISSTMPYARFRYVDTVEGGSIVNITASGKSGLWSFIRTELTSDPSGLPEIASSSKVYYWQTLNDQYLNDPSTYKEGDIAYTDPSAIGANMIKLDDIRETQYTNLPNSKALHFISVRDNTIQIVNCSTFPSQDQTQIIDFKYSILPNSSVSKDTAGVLSIYGNIPGRYKFELFPDGDTTKTSQVIADFDMKKPNDSRGEMHLDNVTIAPGISGILRLSIKGRIVDKNGNHVNITKNFNVQLTTQRSTKQIPYSLQTAGYASVYKCTKSGTTDSDPEWTLQGSQSSTNPYITPQMFGAKANWSGVETFPDKKGDSSTDDSAAFQAALDAGGTVYVPAGYYKLSNTIKITRDHTKLIIDGQVATSAYVGILVQASDIEITGSGTFWFFGRKNKKAIKDEDGTVIEPEDTYIRGTAIRVESTDTFKTAIDGDKAYYMEKYTWRIKIDVRLERYHHAGIYDDFNYLGYGYTQEMWDAKKTEMENNWNEGKEETWETNPYFTHKKNLLLNNKDENGNKAPITPTYDNTIEAATALYNADVEAYNTAHTYWLDNIETRKKWSDPEYDCIAVQVASTAYLGSSWAATYPITVNSTIARFKTAIAIRKEDLRVYDEDGKVIKSSEDNWCTGFEFDGTIEGCMVAIDNARAGGAHYRGSVQPVFPDSYKFKTRNLSNGAVGTYPSYQEAIRRYPRPLATLPSNSYFDTMLWDMHEMINNWGLYVEGNDCVVAGIAHRKYVKCSPESLRNVFLSKDGDPYPTYEITHGHKTTKFYAWENILENAHLAGYISTGTDRKVKSDGTITKSGISISSNIFSSNVKSIAYGKCAAGYKERIITIPITLPEFVSLRGIVVVGKPLPDEVRFTLYGPGDDNKPLPDDVEFTQYEPKPIQFSQYASYMNPDTGEIAGDYKFYNGSLNYAYWNWSYGFDKKIWYPEDEWSAWDKNYIKKIVVELICYSPENTALKDQNNFQIQQILAFAGDISYIPKNGGTMRGPLYLPTPKSTATTQAANVEYVNQSIASIASQSSKLITVTNGKWDFSQSNRVLLKTKDLTSITNLYSGAEGIIITDIDITLPSDATNIKSADFDYVAPSEGEYWAYSFMYLETDSGKQFLWNRTVYK